MTIQIFTVEEVRTQLRARGLTVVDWAKANGFSCSEVYSVLNGRAKGYRGEAHRIAVALGLKANPDSLPQLRFLEIREDGRKAENPHAPRCQNELIV